MRIKKKSSTFGELLLRTWKTENKKKKYFKTQDVSLSIKPNYEVSSLLNLKKEYSVYEVSSLLNLNEEVIRRYFRNGSLQGSKVNNKIVILGKALIAYLEKNNKQN